MHLRGEREGWLCKLFYGAKVVEMNVRFRLQIQPYSTYRSRYDEKENLLTLASIFLSKLVKIISMSQSDQ